MARRKTSIGSGVKWADELMDVLNDFVDDEKQVADRVFHETADDTKKKLQLTSPRRDGSGGGDYAKGWEVKIDKAGLNGDSFMYTVCNPKHYRLTHLLERGHQSFNQYGGPYRRARAKKHIKKAETFGNELLLQRLRARL